MKIARRLASTLALAGLLSLSVLLGGCGQDAPTPEPKPEAGTTEIEIVHDGEPRVELDEDLPVFGQVTYRYSSEIRSLNALGRGWPHEAKIIGFHLSLPLLERHPDELEPMPWLAASLPEIAADGMSQVWELRHEARWPDGSPITSADVVATWRVLTDRSVLLATAALRQDLGSVASITALDDHRFKVTLSRPDPLAAYGFGFNFSPIQKKEAQGDLAALVGRDSVTGCGPYRVAKLAREGCTLERIQPWWGDDLPSFKNRWNVASFVYKVVPDEVQAVEQMRKGLIDFFVGGIPEYQALLADKDELGLEGDHYYLTAFSSIGFNCRKAPFDDARVRRALAMMIPRDAINAQHIGGLARPLSGPFCPGSIYADPEIEPDEYRPAQAKALLAEAGFSDSDGDGVLDRAGLALRFTLSRTTEGRIWSNGLVDLIQESLAQIGVVMTIEDAPSNIIWARNEAGQFDAYTEVWPIDAVFPQVDVYSLFHSSQIAAGGFNWQKCSIPALDQALDEFRNTLNDVKRVQAGRRIHRILHDEAPMIFLFNNPACVVWRKRVLGVQTHALGIRPWDFRVAR